MATPTVASLCSALGYHLVAVEGFQPRDVEITAVHISELVDPNAYLSGGELLLTTGLALPESDIGCRRYVSRLVEADISALALGLGPVHRDPPDRLVRACRDAALTLLSVPVQTPFLMISKAYWKAVSRSTEQQLTDAVAAHRALVDAAIAPDPSVAILRRLAGLVDGWAALLDASGEVDQVYPTSMGGDVQALQVAVTRLKATGVHSSASLSIGGNVVVMFPLAVESRIVGYLAAGSPRQLKPPQRQFILTAAVLLSLDAVRDQRSESAREATRRCVALLVDLGLVEAARRLAAETGSPSPRQEVGLLIAQGRNSEDLVQVVERWCPDVLAVSVDRSTAWFVLPDSHGDLSDLEEQLRSSDSSVMAAVSELVGVDRAGATRARLAQALDSMQPGDIMLPLPMVGQELSRAVDGFLLRAGPEMCESLVAYLRHRGQWEQASKALGLHRNTLRYRVARARDLLGLDLDDPDVAAWTWLALRTRGVA